MQVFVSNPTLQHHDFQYRTNKGKQTRIINIRARGQVVLPDRLEGESLDYVLEQIERAGGVPEKDIKAIKGRFSLLYKVMPDAQSEEQLKRNAVKVEQIERGGKKDEEVRQDLAGDQMEKAGISAFFEAQKVGGRETSIDVTQVTDNSAVKGGVDTEITISAKRGVSKKSTSRKK